MAKGTIQNKRVGLAVDPFCFVCAVLLVDELGVLLVTGLELRILIAEAIESVLQVLGDATLDALVLGDVVSLLERLDAALESFLELLDKGHVLVVVPLVLGFLDEFLGLLVEHQTFADVTILVVRIDLGALLIGSDSLVILTELGTGVTLDIIEGCVVGLVLLGVVDEGEQPFGVLSAGHIVVDETDEETLALRELGEALLEIILLQGLAGSSGVEVGNTVSKLYIDLSVLCKVAIVKALLEEDLCLCVVFCTESSETGIVEGTGVDSCAGLLGGC